MNVQKFAQKLSDEERRLVEGMINQPAKTLEEHHRTVGMIHGLRTAMEILGEILNEDN